MVDSIFVLHNSPVNWNRYACLSSPGGWHAALMAALQVETSGIPGDSLNDPRIARASIITKPQTMAESVTQCVEKGWRGSYIK
jgi:hypothetical protein